MANIVRRIGRIVSKALGLGSIGPDNPVETASQTLDRMRARLAELKACAGAAAANEYRAQRALAAERERLSTIEDASHREECQALVSQMEAQLEDARGQCAQISEQIGSFREQLRQARERIRGAQLESQLSTMRAQAEKLAMDSRVEEGLAAIERMEHRANQALAEARALAELNEALRGEDPCPKKGDDDEH